MLLEIPAVLNAAQLEKVDEVLAQAEFVDGRLTAGMAARRVKDNQEMKQDLDKLLERVERKRELVGSKDITTWMEGQRGIFLYPVSEEESARTHFKSVVEAGLPVLAVLRTPPDRFCKILGRKVEAVWLTTNRIPGILCVDPSNITRLSVVLQEFFEHAPEGVVFLEGVEYLLTDGPPGTGCPVIASVTGTNVVLVVIEPSQTSLHDASRVIELVTGFKIPVFAIINKSDLHPSMAGRIERFLKQATVPLLGRIPFSTEMVDAMIGGKSIVEYAPGSETAGIISAAWDKLRAALTGFPSTK